MTLPKMILFDYGHTLIHERITEPHRGEEELFKYIKTNKRNLSAEEIGNAARLLQREMRDVRRAGFEMQETQFRRLLYGSLGIELRVSSVEAELILWNALAPGEPMPGVERFIDRINALGIRSGVISNTTFSSKAMGFQLSRLIPRNKFELIITSSEYGVRKPNPMLFAVALNQANIKAKEVWYCGDNPEADITGAASVGIFPVWYISEIECHYRDKSKEKLPTCPHSIIREWDELSRLLSTLKRN